MCKCIYYPIYCLSSLVSAGISMPAGARKHRMITFLYQLDPLHGQLCVCERASVGGVQHLFKFGCQNHSCSAAVQCIITFQPLPLVLQSISHPLLF